MNLVNIKSYILQFLFTSNIFPMSSTDWMFVSILIVYSSGGPEFSPFADPFQRKCSLFSRVRMVPRISSDFFFTMRCIFQGALQVSLLPLLFSRQLLNLSNLLSNVNQSLAIVVELLFALALSWLYHYSISNWPIQSRSVEAEIHESLCYIFSSYTH